MKIKGATAAVLSLAIIVGCQKRVIVFPGLPVASAYSPSKGDVIEWDAYDPSQDFQISFSGYYYPTPPCKEAEDTLHTDVMHNVTKVTCHTQAEGTFAYQILPYPPAPGVVPKAATTISPYIQVGPCKGNCTGHGLDESKGKGGSGVTDHAGFVRIPTIQIYCTSAITNPKVQNNPTDPVQGNVVVKWGVFGTPTSFGATFNSTNSSGQPVNSPCSGNNYGPFYGTDNYCTIDPNKHGDYYYTVSDSDCTDTTTAPPPIKITVQ